MQNESSGSILSQFTFGTLVVEYLLDRITGLVGLRLHPLEKSSLLTPRREWLDDFEHRKMADSSPKLRACPVDSLVQVKCVGDDYPTGFSQGYSLRNSATTLGLKYERQERNGNTITTFLRDEKGRCAEHYLTWHEGDLSVEVSTKFRNDSPQTVSLELLSSFSLGDITPFHPADAPNRLRVHRLRSAWSAEGRLHTQTIEELNLERSWQDHAVRCERFGQVGSMPVKGFFPFAAVEDIQTGVLWGAQIAWAGSWQMELYRQSDALCLSGGLADREFGHWVKNLEPGESLSSPTATVACVVGDLDALCHALTDRQQLAADLHPQVEADLPIICNEFCTTWGNPTHTNIEALARRLQGSPVRYLVIDAGWYGAPGSAWWNEQGDWMPSSERFPEGLATTAEMIRSHGLIPGIWFEMEVAGTGSATFGLAGHQLQRDGFPVTTTKRHFWDFRDPWVADYLAGKVIGLLRDCGFGYVKFDYNETIGIGCDGAESIGEGLREHIAAFLQFFDRIREELPELVIECCSSGGHRLEPSMLARSSMSSFSDAHESLEIPIIAANMHRAMLPRQSQIWAVLRAADDAQRITYSLAATFLGRMCLSGDLHDLNSEQWSLTLDAITSYQRVAHLIKHGKSQRFGPVVKSYRHPEGWQSILRIGHDGSEALLVAHTFGGSQEMIVLPGTGAWSVAGTFPPDSIIWTDPAAISFKLAGSFAGLVVHLRRAN